jgi:hypothetical protein
VTLAHKARALRQVTQILQVIRHQVASQLHKVIRLRRANQNLAVRLLQIQLQIRFQTRLQIQQVNQLRHQPVSRSQTVTQVPQALRNP